MMNMARQFYHDISIKVYLLIGVLGLRSKLLEMSTCFHLFRKGIL